MNDIEKIKLKPIKSTNWARRFKRNCLSDYEEGVRIANLAKIS